MKMKENAGGALRAGKVFLGGVLIYILAVLPFLISHDGLFFYYGDYNVQQVPFLIFAHRAVRQGRFFWNPLVDLGGNMCGTFAFYLWGSPFFWLTVPFPEHLLPYMMPYLMAMKTGTAAAFAYKWIRTQTRTDGAAVIGGLLYAFSGFQACNIVFQHFHDATAFFPLYLLAFDRFVEAGRRGEGTALQRIGFVLMTAWMSVINYYFFFGQTVFLILYYFTRWGVRRLRTEGPGPAAAEAGRLLIGGLTGLLLASPFLVQSIGGILGNARVSKFLSGYDLVAYPDSTTPLAILRSFFMVPDLIARGTLFTSDNIRNGSLAFYLPCFAMAGVFAFWFRRRKSWKKNLLVILAVMAFVPVLCAAFSAFNSNFYARWFYMPVLLSACLTAEMLEEEDSTFFTKGAALSLGFTAFFVLCCFLPVCEDGKWSFTAISENRDLLMTEVEATLLGAACLVVLVLVKRYGRHLFGGEKERITLREKILSPDTLCLVLTVLCCLTSTAAVLHNGSSLISHTGFEKWRRQMLTERPVFENDTGKGSAEYAAGTTDPFSRVETDSTSTNYEMVWGIPTMHCFESTVHPSIFRWYKGIGMIRTVESTLPYERIGARAVMSVRYYLENTLVKTDSSYSDEEGMQGYRLCNDQNGYNVYETVNYIPMGFSFDSYMTEENYDLLDNGTVSDRVLVRDIILSEEMAEKYGGLLEEDTDIDPGVMPYGEFTAHCADRAGSACREFAFDRNGFHARAQMDRDNLLLFSIPYDRGFRATVDGEPAELERADFGLSAIYVPEGDHMIRVTYFPSGLVPCLLLSLLTAAGLVLYTLRSRGEYKPGRLR